MIVYEVNLSVERDIEHAYLEWLRRHVDEILSFDGFTGAEVFEVENGSARVELVVRYTLRDRNALEQYFLQHADRMRRDGTDRFGAKFNATRRVMTPLTARESEA